MTVEQVAERKTGLAFRLVASVEPSVVFASLAAQCVPGLCDTCTIDIVDGSHARYRIAYPSRRATAGGLLRLSERAAATVDHTVRVPFRHSSGESARRPGHDQMRPPEGFEGVATFLWDRRTSTHADRVLAGVLVDHALRTVAWQRSEQAAHAAATDAANLRVALRASRHIGAAVGILMGLHKLTENEALDMLRLASHRTNRKLRDLAGDVIESGWVDPALIRGSASKVGRP